MIKKDAIELISDHERVVRWMDKIRSEAIEEVRANWRVDVAKRNKRIAELEAERDAQQLRADGYAELCRAYRVGHGGSHRIADRALSKIDKAEDALNALALRKEVGDG